MAKTTQEYFDLLKAELVDFPELAALASDVNNAQELLVKLTTTSQVANWDLMTWIQAVGCNAADVEIEHTMNTIFTEIPKRRYGSFPWYVEMAKVFQFGDTIQWLDGKFFYETINLEARIISHAAAVKIAQGLRLKVAVVSGGELAPAATPVIEALNSYFNDQEIGIKPAGVHLVITSTIPDLLKLAVRVVRNPQVLSSTGELLSAPGTYPVENAINQYVQYLPFNGEFNITELEDKIQQADGVLDVEIDEAFSKYGGFPYQPIDLKYKADAGYMKIDPLFPLNSSITYLI